MLAPGSDIDLLFLLPDKPTPAVEKVVEALLYVLWDLKQKVGHATRTVEECLKQARADMTIRTTLIEARLVTGDRTLFETLQSRFDKEIVAKTAPEFVAAKLAEREERVKRAGASRYLVEPNIKEGKGGLRDLNTLFWISKYVYRVQNPHDLIAAGVFSPREFALFRRCEEFLWSVRCRLHFLAGRAEERLSFDVQRPIARQLGYSTRAGQADVERFMKHYFLVAKDVGDLTAIVCAALEERQTKPVPVFDRFIGRLGAGSTRAIADAKDFKVEADRVNVLRPDAFERDPVNLIRLFWVAERSNLPIHPNATRLVTQSLKRIDARLREDPEANRLFLEILTSRHAPETALRRMNEAGVLGRFIPDFGRVVGMMQFSMYHHYTVDEHLIRTVGALSAIEAGRLKDEHPLSSEFIHKISHRTELYLAAFLHDIAKGRPTDHSKTGADVARKLCPRLGLSPGQHRSRRLAGRAASRHVQHGAGPRPLRSAHRGGAGGDRADAGAAEDAADPDGRRHPRRRAGRLERLERPAPAHALLGDRGRAGRRPFGGRRARRASRRPRRRCAARCRGGRTRSSTPTPSATIRPTGSRWSRSGRSPTPNLLHAMAADVRSLATEVTTDSFRGVTAVTVVAPDHPRLLSGIAGRLRRGGRQHRRRADLHHDRRPRRSTRSSSRAPSNATRTSCGAASGSPPTSRGRCAARCGWRRLRRRKRLATSAAALSPSSPR